MQQQRWVGAEAEAEAGAGAGAGAEAEAEGRERSVETVQQVEEWAEEVGYQRMAALAWLQLFLEMVGVLETL